MKCLVLLSLVVYCTCVPVTISKHITVDVNIERPDETLDQTWQKPSYWNQHDEEPRYQEATPDFLNSWYQRYLQQYMPWAQTKETTYGADFPWNQYSNAREFEQLTPAQLFLNHFKSQRYNDVSDEEYLQKMFNQYIPEYLQENQLNYKQVLPILQKYIEQLPQKQLFAMQNTMQTPFIPSQFMQRTLKQLYKNLGQVPYTREQIMNYIMDNVEDFPNHYVSQGELEQLVEFFQHLQSFVNFVYQRHAEQTVGYEKMEQFNPWTRFFQNLKQNIVERQNQNQQVYQNWEQPQADQWTRYYQGQDWRFPRSRDWSQRVNVDQTEFPQQWAHYYQEKVPTGQEWRFPLSHDWNQRVNVDQTEFPQQWARFYQEKVPAGQEWRFPLSYDWNQRINVDQTEFPQQWARFYQEKVPAGQEWRFPLSYDWNQRINVDQTEFPQQWAHFYQEKVPAGQEWRFPWSHDWSQRVNVDQTEFPQQRSVQKDVPQLWQWNRNEYPQRWYGQH